MARKSTFLIATVLLIVSYVSAGLDVSFQNALPQYGYQDSTALNALSTKSYGYTRLDEVPTSRWTYGCSATAAGMMFGYYDRHGYSNMYTGPSNGGVAPLYDLGANCSIIATRKGFDGRVSYGHVDDYWKVSGSSGPDPWEGVRQEHTWGDCVADYMGTNQAKWDWDGDGHKEFNVDGSTALWSYDSGEKLYDYKPPVSGSAPQTALCHGLRLFAESRGYEVIENYTQKIDTLYSNGFSFEDFVFEIDSGRPVMVQLAGHSMLGVGYDENDASILFHNTWDNSVHSMEWGGTYAEMDFVAVTVLHLADADVPEPATCFIFLAGIIPVISRKIRFAKK